MNLIIDHLEYLLQRHDCVTLPGIGAIIARYIPARLAPGSDMLLPPTRQLVFNGQLEESDGLLERSVSRQCGISYEAASRIVSEESASLRSQLIEFGELNLGKIGHLSVNGESRVMFQPSPIEGWDFRFYGLKTLKLIPIQADTSATNQDSPNLLQPVLPYQSIGISELEEEKPQRRILARVISVAASLAIIVTLALFLLNPIHVSNEPAKASLAPVETVSTETNKATNAETNLVENVSEPQSEPAEEVAASTDRYYVIVASFPNEQQAVKYISENPSRHLSVLNKDGKYRVYSAAAPTLEEAENLRAQTSQQDAWVCAR